MFTFCSTQIYTIWHSTISFRNISDSDKTIHPMANRRKAAEALCTVAVICLVRQCSYYVLMSTSTTTTTMDDGAAGG